MLPLNQIMMPLTPLVDDIPFTVSPPSPPPPPSPLSPPCPLTLVTQATILPSHPGTGSSSSRTSCLIVPNSLSTALKWNLNWGWPWVEEDALGPFSDWSIPPSVSTAHSRSSGGSSCLKSLKVMLPSGLSIIVMKGVMVPSVK